MQTEHTPTAPSLPPTRLHYETEEKLLRGDVETETAVAEPVQEPIKAEPSESPELEADSLKPDADLSEAARALRRNRADERKKKLHLEVQEALGERARVRDELSREREELARLRAEREHFSRGAQPRPATAGAAPAGTTFTFPAFDQWASGANDGQTYEAYLDARDDARDDWKASLSRERVARHTADRSTQEIASKLENQHETTRERYADFDAVIEPVLVSLRGTPRGMDAAQFFASSEVGGEVAYRLGKDATALKVVSEAPNRAALHRALTHVESDILAARKAPKPTTSAPAPPSQTVTSAATASTARTPNSTAEHYAKEQAEIEERRKRGYRY